jgi:DNA-binding IscR family transcriptional regulator
MTIELIKGTKMAQAYEALYTTDKTKGGGSVSNLALDLGISRQAAASLIGDLRRRKIAVDKRRDGAIWLMYTTQKVALSDVVGVERPAKTATPKTTPKASTAKTTAPKSRTRRKTPVTKPVAAPAPATA